MCCDRDNGCTAISLIACLALHVKSEARLVSSTS